MKSYFIISAFEYIAHHENVNVLCLENKALFNLFNSEKSSFEHDIV